MLEVLSRSSCQASDRFMSGYSDIEAFYAGSKTYQEVVIITKIHRSLCHVPLQIDVTAA
jgi:hypothetical protein